MSMTMHATRDDNLDRMARRMEHWVEQTLGPTYHRYCPGGTWSPAVNLYEAPGHYCVVVDLAGMSADKIDLRLEKNLLRLSGERPVPAMPGGCKPTRVHLMEIDHGRFCRTVEVPSDVAGEGITAKYDGGYLFIRLPRKNAK